ncbi:MAG: LacI family transcriptional regulator, partial [Acidimicrobiaceae bacterium]
CCYFRLKSIPVRRDVATIHDVAKRSAVSAATVSRFMRGERVRRGDAVRQAIKELDYRPAAAARSLRSGVHFAIAVIVPDVTNPFFAAVVKGMESVLRGGPYSLFLANTDESFELERDVIAHIMGRVDGIVLAPATEQDPNPQRLVEAGIPVVFVDRDLVDGSVDSVLVDNVGGARLAAKHLVQLGHRDIAIISGPLNTTPGRERHEGFVSELTESGIETPERFIELSDFRESGGYSAMLRLLASPHRPTAVFCANNLMSIGALKALDGMRVDVPRDMSVIGFDDLDLSPLMRSPLTVIDRPSVEQGAIAARIMLSLLANPAPHRPQRVVLPVQLLQRASTSAPSRPATNRRPHAAAQPEGSAK